VDSFFPSFSGFFLVTDSVFVAHRLRISVPHSRRGLAFCPCWGVVGRWDRALHAARGHKKAGVVLWGNVVRESASRSASQATRPPFLVGNDPRSVAPAAHARLCFGSWDSSPQERGRAKALGSSIFEEGRAKDSSGKKSEIFLARL